MSNLAKDYMREFTIQDMYSIKSDHGERYELMKGMLRVSEPPGFTHGDVALNIGMLLKLYVKKHRLGKVVTESGFILTHNPDSVRGPDIAFVYAERLKGKFLDSFFNGAPDLAVEVLSPNDRFPEVEQKIWQYFEAGGRMVWIVDPAEQTVSVRRPGQDAQRLEGKDLLDGEDVVPGFSCRVWELFV